MSIRTKIFLLVCVAAAAVVVAVLFTWYQDQLPMVLGKLNSEEVVEVHLQHIYLDEDMENFFAGKEIPTYQKVAVNDPRVFADKLCAILRRESIRFHPLHAESIAECEVWMKTSKGEWHFEITTYPGDREGVVNLDIYENRQMIRGSLIISVQGSKSLRQLKDGVETGG